MTPVPRMLAPVDPFRYRNVAESSREAPRLVAPDASTPDLLVMINHPPIKAPNL